MTSLPSHGNNISGGVIAVLLGLLAILISAPAQAQSVSLGYTSGTSTNISGAGLKLNLAAIPDFASAPDWQLTSFTWLSTSGAYATGRGYILIFDAALFSPVGKDFTEVNAATTGLIAKSETYAGGAYSFSTAVTLDSTKTYYILNSSAITTGTATPAPYQYGYSTSVSLTGIERLINNSSTWAVGTGSPNFSATFAPIPEPATAAILLGLVGMACVLFRRRR